MEEKTNEIRHIFRSVFGFRNIYKLFPFKSFHPRNLGFSLVELLVVIAVIGILASAAIVVINPVAQMEKARDSERKADLKQIQAALELYRSDQGEYPSTLGDLSSGSVKYLSQVPQDPKSGSYSYSKTGGDYSISACAERLTASDDDVIADATCTKRFRIIFYSP